VNVLWSDLPEGDGVSYLLDRLERQEMVQRAEDASVGFVGALLYDAERVATLVSTAEQLAALPYATDPLLRARPVEPDLWLALPDTPTPFMEAWVFEVVASSESPLLAFRGGPVEEHTPIERVLARLRSGLVGSRRRGRCMRAARHADCKPDDCDGTCRSYAVLDGADVLLRCSCISS
jgi:hypothetical protein